ncbi:hypothetical protein KC19_5G007900 [Ceratodon purpureus]|uniref:Uncharacterized protein n=1 Tax=Ceratodon purpureus TaxID=3225 RepID=A0A8T0HWQ2_CERPU|nr:hypothetical protein KC19_5G007900 [Ceratodon purpureus]
MAATADQHLHHVLRPVEDLGRASHVAKAGAGSAEYGAVESGCQLQQDTGGSLVQAEIGSRPKTNDQNISINLETKARSYVNMTSPRSTDKIADQCIGNLQFYRT